MTVNACQLVLSVVFSVAARREVLITQLQAMYNEFQPVRCTRHATHYS